MTDRLTSTSKFLSYVLRHRPDAVGVTLDEAGWVPVDVLLAALARHGRPVTPALLDQLVGNTDKQRFEVREGRIRAAQGHTIAVDLQLAPAVPPTVLYHGTVARFLPGIRVEGLTSGERTHVHLSSDLDTAARVGARRGKPVVLRIDAAGMHVAGLVLYRAANGVWLTRHVPPRFITLPS
ncbi:MULTISPECIES: RNA 2'-phosphotransferase [Micromonospora]|uniref:Probable RNA 2'-phosphotransferase n=1 Tax=Micromonospora maris TaxID=1003110 RepID=A0A9X0I2B2_9ACTN|nr:MULTISPECIES: RNA 2'-phosphotransferase [Micromonospora]AEB46204.1 phosphate acetyltransferase [Micromonospora maris AB-18-032]KUJ45464.1 RNA 2'-phosphotransferase [Micromonospora maris]RUL94477.1 RNA 2'-phosphotransferase [Verrucosispora sp. FIM060022]